MSQKTVRINDYRSILDGDDEEFSCETSKLLSASIHGTRGKQRHVGGVRGDEVASTSYDTSQEKHDHSNREPQKPSLFRGISSDEGICVSQEPVNNDQITNVKPPQRPAAPQRSTALPRAKSAVFTPPQFDVLFENPAKLHFAFAGESLDEGIHSFDNGSSFDNSTRRLSSSPSKKVDDISAKDQTVPLKRLDSIMELSFTEMMVKHWENSQGLAGFRHKLGNDINHKYCSYCRCDDIIFIFLYVVFGMICICTGCLGFTQCSSELYVNVFLITNGVLSVFVFPITIMEWTKRIGGCVKKNDIQGHGITFIAIVILRIAAATAGSVVIAMRINVYQQDDLMCWTVLRLLEIGVVIEWAFLLLVLLLPLLLYTVAYFIARRL